MTFISYAQNFEDLTLWRFFKFSPAGFYIDVGAFDPTSDSVTKAFYDRGWNGINIDAHAVACDRMRAERPRDVNIHAAVSDTDGETVLFDLQQSPSAPSGLATVDQKTVQMYMDEGKQLMERRVETRTLRSICEQYVTGEIHFLKIDVEGHEGAVLRGMDFERWRPWILVIEVPFNVRPDWEQLMQDARYHFAHHDGLNRYYLAEEHMDLVNAFDYPPNVLDEFQLCYGHRFSYPVEVLEERIRIEAHRANVAEAKLAQIRASYRWKIIHPVAAWRQFIQNRKQPDSM